MVISYRFLVIAAIFITCLITANIIAVRLITLGVGPWKLGGLELPAALPAAIIIFPLSYIFGDILTEVYGYRQARRVIWLGFLCNLIAVSAFWAAGRIPALDTDVQAAYGLVFDYVPRILAASFVAYLAGEFANSFVLAKMKIKTNGRFLWSRTIGSTIVGQGLDAAVFIAIAFGGVKTGAFLGSMIITHWLVKTLYEVAATPFTYAVVNYLKKKERVDTYDYDTDFNPLLVTR
ncbi:MAG: queuosine precursor transporter [Dehalococcoidia bacterium]|nr:MAG: queuosine precursor transporter [Dehalococcoidia bacterium]